jgi:predicted transglutaminase-like cysteine proteinase
VQAVIYPWRLVAIFAVSLAVAIPAWADLFGAESVRTTNVASIPKWTGVMARTQAENLLGNCTGGGCEGLKGRWVEKLAEWRGLSRDEQMRLVNRWFNQRPYIEDRDNWGQNDFWVPPGVFLQRSGDCEDYAIAKYYTLKALGWEESSLRLVVLRDRVRGIAHAVLAVRLNGTQYILDNLSTEPLPDSMIRQYAPYYAINATHRWVFMRPQD